MAVEGDRVLVTFKDGRHLKKKLLSPLKAEGRSSVGGYEYEIKHEDIIGKSPGRLYINAAGKKQRTLSLRVTHPSLDEFIYASYSAFMTNLLDIHVSPPHTTDSSPDATAELEILEAGTGHGSLTLHLARAIAAANQPPPVDGTQEAWESWRSSRKAILHTIEFVKSRSRDTEKLIRSFRSGLYWPHIDFYSGDAAEWVRNEIQRRQEPGFGKAESGEFLDIVCLDMPNVHAQIRHMEKAMKKDGQLLIYAPQITQLAACQQEIDRLELPLKLDQILELGEGISNGREWDLRFVKPRSEQKLGQQRSNALDTTSQSPISSDDESVEIVETELDTDRSSLGDSQTNITDTTADPIFPTMVCRPLVGKLIMGGAFVGLWRKVVLPQRDAISRDE